MTKYLFVLLACITAPALADSTGSISGAGSSAAFPVYRTWAEGYQRATGAQVKYDPIGSSAGIKKIKARETDFGASDVIPTIEDLEKSGLVALPTVIIGVTPFYNLPKLKGIPLTLSGTVLADIFLGEITHWDDKQIAALNAQIKLPHLPIRVVVRSDGSGTTYNFADYLAKVSPAWLAQRGVANSLKWPTNFLTGKGSTGVVETVQATKGAISYVDYNYVVEYKLDAARMINAHGEIVSASPHAFRAALNKSSWQLTGDFKHTLTNQPGKSSWPITMGTFVVLPKIAQHPEQVLAAVRFFTWAFIHGDELANRVNFVRLPDLVQAKAFRVLAEIVDNSGHAIGYDALREQIGGRP